MLRLENASFANLEGILTNVFFESLHYPPQVLAPREE